MHGCTNVWVHEKNGERVPTLPLSLFLYGVSLFSFVGGIMKKLLDKKILMVGGFHAYQYVH